MNYKQIAKNEKRAAFLTLHSSGFRKRFNECHIAITLEINGRENHNLHSGASKSVSYL